MSGISTSRRSRSFVSAGWHGRVAIAAAVAAFPAFARAQTDNWDGTSSSWNTGSNWSYGLVPGNGYTVNFALSGPDAGLTHTVNYDYTGPAVTLATLTVDHTNTSGSTVATVNMAANALTVGGSEFIGYNGTAYFNQSGGTNTVVGAGFGAFYLGYSAQADGNYSLSGTGTLSSNVEDIGAKYVGSFTQIGNASFLQSGNTLNTAGDITIGGGGSSYILSSGIVSATGTVGGVNVTAGALFIQTGGDVLGGLAVNSTGSMYELSGAGTLSTLGEISAGGGTISQTGGMNLVGTLSISAGGSYALSGGTLQFTALNIGLQSGATGVFTLSGTGSISGSGNESIGDLGSGIFNQSVGTNSPGTLYLGQSGSGTYLLGGTGSVSVTGNEYVGYTATGNFNQTGGMNTVGTLYLADQARSNGTYGLSGTASVSAATEYVGYVGTGTFNQSAGTNATGNLQISSQVASAGTYNLSGGNLLAENVTVGTAGLARPTTGVFNVDGSGAWANISGTLSLYDGTINVSAGTLSAASVNLGTTFNQTGGSVIFSGLTETHEESPIYNLSEGKLTLIPGGTPQPGPNLVEFNDNGGGILDFQIGGTSNFFNYASLLVGSATISGTLEIDWVNGFMPSVGEQFSLLSAGNDNIGTFSNLITNNSLITYTVNYGSEFQNNDVIVVVTSVPEPAAFSIFALGGLISLRRRRHKYSPRL